MIAIFSSSSFSATDAALFISSANFYVSTSYMLDSTPTLSQKESCYAVFINLTLQGRTIEK